MALKSRSISSPGLTLIAEMEDPGLSVVEEEEEDFFERIEAPKFFDFTIPEISRPEQSSWFCTRIGCDQNHEEVEPGELNRSFMLRVMAARSPNVWFQRALNNQCSRANTKCPQSAPAKSTRNGISRMIPMSSISEQSSMAKLKQHPITSLRETPIQKRPKMPSSKKEQTATANNKSQAKCLKTSDTVMASKERNLVKALFSHTPKKAAGSCRAPISETCSEKKKKKMMMMVNAVGERKRMSRGSSATSSNKCKGSSIPSTKTSAVCSKFRIRSILKEVPHNEIKDVQFGVESNDSEHVEEKNTILVKSNGEEQQAFESDSGVSIKPGKEEVRSVVLKVSSGTGSEIKAANNVKNDDDKENSLFAFENKNMRTNVAASEGKRIRFENSHPQEAKVQNKAFHGAKLNRTTNPKPFRLRTDERGILREANLERRLQVESKKEPATLLKHVDAIQRKQKNSQAKLAKATQTQKLNSKKEKIIQDSHTKSLKIVSTKQPLKITSETRERRESISRMFKERGGLIKKLQGRKLATTPKEPKFHRIHVPKNCIRRYEMTIS